MIINVYHTTRTGMEIEVTFDTEAKTYIIGYNKAFHENTELFICAAAVEDVIHVLEKLKFLGFKKIVRNDIVQYSIDVGEVYEDMERKITEALINAGFAVVGIDWKARWTPDDYYKGKPPISSN